MGEGPRKRAFSLGLSRLSHAAVPVNRVEELQDVELRLCGAGRGLLPRYFVADGDDI